MNPNILSIFQSRATSILKQISLIGASVLLAGGVSIAGSFTAGNLAILQAAASATNTTCSVIELSPSTAGQTPSNTISISGTGANAIRISSSATSTGYVSRSADGSLLTFTGANSTDTTSNVNTLTTRAVVTLNSAGSAALATTYTGSTGNQARSATSLNNTSWFISDQAGIYTNGTSAASPSGNTRSTRAFGGTVYVLTSATTTAAAAVTTLSAPSGSTLAVLPGLPATISANQDFYMISSGTNGSTYDVLYILAATSNTAGTISKYSLVAGTWTANGSYTTSFGGFGIAAAKSGSGAVLYVSTGLGALTANSVLKLTDTAGYNATISITTANNVTLYTAPTGAIIKGVDFAPVTTATPTITGAATAAAFTTTYGTASTAQTFAVSGSNLTANLVATAPTGFQVSSDGTTYGTTATFTQSGGTASGSLRVRLAATATVSGAYNSQNVALASTGATTVNIATSASGNSVTAKALTITANNATKSFGATLTGGSGSTAFTSSGLVGAETIGSVTINYGSGASAGDAAGSYLGSVTATAATGGTFTASNYSITYVAGDITVSASPAISTVGSLSAVNTTYGTDSPSPTSFSVSGGNLTGDLTVTAPSGFEISSGGTYATSLNLTATSGTVSTTTISVRLSATAAAATYSGNVTVSGGGAPTQNVPTVSSTVAPKGLTVTGLAAVSREYDASINATLSGTAAYTGLENSESFSVTGTPAASFATKTVGTAKPVTVSGYTAPSSNYSVTQPSGLTAGITAKALTITSAAVTSRPYNATLAATITGGLSGVVALDAVTLVGTGTFADANAATGIAVTSTSTLAGADSANYSLTQPIGLTGNITQAVQTITFAALPAKSISDAPFALTATASSGLTVVYSSSNTSVATIAGSTVTLAGVGTTTISATQAGNANYSAATQVDQVLTVGTGPTVLAVGDIAIIGVNASTTDSFAVVLLKDIAPATVINFTDNGFSSATAGRTGEGFLTYTAPTALSAGTVLTWTNGMTITGTGWSSSNPANFAFNSSGDQFFVFQGSTANWATSSSVTVLCGVNYGIALLTTGTAAAATTYPPDTSILPASALLNLPSTSANNIYFANGSTATASVTVSDSKAALFALFEDSTKWFTSSALVSFPAYSIAIKTPQTITFGTLASKTYGDAAFVLGATASSGLSVSYASSNTGVATVSGNTVTIVGPGTTTITASQAGNATYSAAADVTQTLTVNKASQTIADLAASDSKTYGDAAFALGATASSGLTVSYASSNIGVATVSGNIVTIVGPGVTTITASQAGNTTYSAATDVTQTLTVNKASQTITGLATSASKTYGDAAFALGATASSGLSVSYASSNTGVATVSGNTVTIVGAGIAIITASQAGDGNYNPAMAVDQTLTVATLGLTITGVSGVNKPYDRNTSASLTGTPTLNGLVAGDSGNVTVSGSVSANFATATIGTSKAVTVTGYTLAGSAAANYTVAQPAGLSADITPLALTVSGAAVTSKTYDGNTSATITGTLTGVISPDVVTFNGTGTFASSAVGTGIAVTSTSTLGGANAGNYSLTQPTGLTGNITADPAVDLSRYVRVARYDLPEPTRTTAPSGSLLAQEASNVTYNWDTDTLFIAGDGGTSIVQVSKTGALINSMTLALNASRRAGVEFDDTEGLTYIGNGEFVITEERDRTLVKFTYAAGTTLTRAAAKTVKLGTTIGNIGLEGVCYDPQTGGFIVVKEKTPESIFQTNIDWNALTATNGSPTATSSTDLFNPSLLSTLDFSDVFAMSNLPALIGTSESSHLLVISQESGQIVNCDRSGTVYSRLTIAADPGSVLTVPDMTMEGVCMDRSGYLYITNENGGGDANHPQLWVYAPSTATNVAPTAVALQNPTSSIPENTSTAADVKLADVIITDDGLGVNNLTVTGADAVSFNIVGTSLFLKAGTTLNSTTKPTYAVTVNVDDTSVGSTPDASVNFTLTVTASTGGTPQLVISEVAPWSSSNGIGLLADWFEVTNIGTAAQSIVGWKMDDNSNAFGSAVPLNGITSIAPGESVIFIESAVPSTAVANFKTLWFGSNPPASLQIGTYTGTGVGLSTAGDAVNLFNAAGAVQARVDFGTSPTVLFKTFDNASGLNNVVLTNLAATGINGAFIAAGHSDEIGSPGTIGGAATPIISIVATDANAAETGSDPGTFRISRSGSTTGSLTVNYTIAIGAGQAIAADYTPTLNGVAIIPSGQSYVDIAITPVDDALVEGNETLTLTLFDTGSYDVGSPSTATVTLIDNDLANAAPSAVALNNAVTNITEITPTTSAVKVGDIVITDDGQGTNSLSLSGTDAASFTITGSALYLKAGTTLNQTTKPSYAVTVNVDDTTVGSTPDASVNFTLTVLASPTPGSIIISEVAPWGSSNSAPVSVDWFEITNNGTTAVDITGWKTDDNSNSFTVAAPMSGVTSIAPGESVVFLETTDLAGKSAAFKTLWFGSNPPAGLKFGAYAGSGVGLSSAGDAVNLFDISGNRITGVNFGASSTGTFYSFDNKAGLGTSTTPLPNLTTLSAIGVNGAFAAANDALEVGSPGTTTTVPPINSWRLTYFGTTSNSGNSSDNADFDGDGISNLMEYALGMNPTLTAGANGIASLPTGLLSDPDALLIDRLTLSFNLPNPSPVDISYIVESTDDLETWTAVASKTGSGAWTWLGGGTNHIVTNGTNPITVKVGDLVPSSGNPRRLMRLKAKNP